MELDGPIPATTNVHVTIPWRRHDTNPGAKAIVVVDASTNQPVTNALAVRIDKVSGDVVFQPNAGSPKYFVYYMPWQSSGGSYPVVTYKASVIQPDKTWADAVRTESAASQRWARTTRCSP